MKETLIDLSAINSPFCNYLKSQNPDATNLSIKRFKCV
ncbi:hypothetical protein KR51_00015240 [Rubidibacter lacunae KORDI 51-2]|uniref:Uncharacterized protein n=1 Tax=Rubidibacter lacunae KORDI 51-2 TaxID=582515 RepID=U5DMM1_9CHRO|nr:hypothetical protein KR51_00015240 [Rubidibacter lacunae KORDI 51-2]